MRQKTRLSVAEQVRRTMAMLRQYYDNCARFGLRQDWYGSLGQMVVAHRLFNAGDIIWVGINAKYKNEEGRSPVLAVSSKGFVVRRFWLQYARCRYDTRRHRLRGGRFGKVVRMESGPQRFTEKTFRFVDLPVGLRQLAPDEPDVQRYLVSLIPDVPGIPQVR